MQKEVAPISLVCSALLELLRYSTRSSQCIYVILTCAVRAEHLVGSEFDISIKLPVLIHI